MKKLLLSLILLAAGTVWANGPLTPAQAREQIEMTLFVANLGEESPVDGSFIKELSDEDALLVAAMEYDDFEKYVKADTDFRPVLLGIERLFKQERDYIKSLEA